MAMETDETGGERSGPAVRAPTAGPHAELSAESSSLFVEFRLEVELPKKAEAVMRRRKELLVSDLGSSSRHVYAYLCLALNSAAERE